MCEICTYDTKDVDKKYRIKKLKALSIDLLHHLYETGKEEDLNSPDLVSYHKDMKYLLHPDRFNLSLNTDDDDEEPEEIEKTESKPVEEDHTNIVKHALQIFDELGGSGKHAPTLRDYATENSAFRPTRSNTGSYYMVPVSPVFDKAGEIQGYKYVNPHNVVQELGPIHTYLPGKSSRASEGGAKRSYILADEGKDGEEVSYSHRKILDQFKGLSKTVSPLYFINTGLKDDESEGRGEHLQALAHIPYAGVGKKDPNYLAHTKAFAQELSQRLHAESKNKFNFDGVNQILAREAIFKAKANPKVNSLNHFVQLFEEFHGIPHDEREEHRKTLNIGAIKQLLSGADTEISKLQPEELQKNIGRVKHNALSKEDHAWRYNYGHTYSGKKIVNFLSTMAKKMPNGKTIMDHLIENSPKKLEELHGKFAEAQNKLHNLELNGESPESPAYKHAMDEYHRTRYEADAVYSIIFFIHSGMRHGLNELSRKNTDKDLRGASTIDETNLSEDPETKDLIIDYTGKQEKKNRVVTRNPIIVNYINKRKQLNLQRKQHLGTLKSGGEYLQHSIPRHKAVKLEHLPLFDIQSDFGVSSPKKGMELLGLPTEDISDGVHFLKGVGGNLHQLAHSGIEAVRTINKVFEGPNGQQLLTALKNHPDPRVTAHLLKEALSSTMPLLEDYPEIQSAIHSHPHLPNIRDEQLERLDRIPEKTAYEYLNHSPDSNAMDNYLIKGLHRNGRDRFMQIYARHLLNGGKMLSPIDFLSKEGPDLLKGFHYGIG